MDPTGRETLVTEEGYAKLKEELDHLVTVRRSEVAERIRTAREYGDISENAEYDAAKDEQAKLEARILQVEDRIRTARVVTEVARGEVGIGTKVVVVDAESGDEETFVIVGSTEADPLENKVSHESPVGRALMGQKKGATVEVPVPAGTLRLEVKSVRKA